MKEPTMLIVGDQPRRRRGRPRAEEPGSAVTVWLPASLHDRLIDVANRREMSVSALIRAAIVVTVPAKQRNT